MIVEAYVLPCLGRSTGVAFWEGRRGSGGARSPGAGTAAAPTGRAPRRRGDSRPVEPDTFAVYAPGELSAGEVAALQAAYVASLGRTVREAGHALGAGWPLFWWWVAGVVAVVLLLLRALELGPGFGWIVLVCALTTLPAGAAGVAWPLLGRRVGLARRLARRAGRLVPARGADPRAQERLDGLWRLARRLQGPPAQQLQELEAYCREQAWRQAAQFYADRRRALGGGQTRRARLVPAWLSALGRWLGGLAPARPAYAVKEMRAW